MDGLIALALAKKYTDKVKSDIIDAGFKVQVEEDRSILNRQGEEKVLYLLPKEYGSDQDGYDEFVYVNRNWEWVGKTDVSLDYLLLDNKPVISGRTSLDSWVQTPIQGMIFFNDEDFKAYISQNPSDPSRNEFGINLSSSIPINYMQTDDGWGEYDFNSLYGAYINSGTFRIPVTNVRNKPSIFEPFIGDIFITHYFQECSYLKGTKLIRFAVGTNADHKNLCFWQIVSMTNEGNEYVVELASNNWQELTSGGAQIVSGAVNANGTITFTDSEGNSFTTSGSNLVTSSNEQVSVGYDEDGFYFLFDDGQEEVNNVTD